MTKWLLSFAVILYLITRTNILSFWHGANEDTREERYFLNKIINRSRWVDGQCSLIYWIVWANCRLFEVWHGIWRKEQIAWREASFCSGGASCLLSKVHEGNEWKIRCETTLLATTMSSSIVSWISRCSYSWTSISSLWESENFN